ncbi:MULTISPECIES: DUF6236 family protein [Streptomyces]|uniref:Uncharacterized protein n=1 Tax=Streptomyces dengpaensis TaxID=2049881 RepID=A0ABN5HZH0_9ACTN|nr:MULTISPECIES: DUF6236 family protein [Streptomyces]AVH56531.1 hypothetical protein C4B68_12945 [Streptomyces dengpaensis]PIB10444.1 hypothetical protein B1C81_08165 [Streptomyces sp. HG99]
MLQRIGLYYPYINFRDERWLKTAALYWPQLARIVPARFPTTDSDTVRALAEELDFIVPVEPASSTLGVSSAFLDVIAAHAEDLRQRYGAAAGPHPRSPAYLHRDEVAAEVREALFDAGIAVPSRGTRFSEPGVVAGPLISSAAGVTFAVAGLARTATGERQALLASSPSAYLLSVEKGLETRSLMRRFFRQPSARGGGIT